MEAKLGTSKKEDNEGNLMKVLKELVKEKAEQE